MVCGSSALGWMLAGVGIDIRPDDIDAVALTDPEFDLLVERLRRAARAGRFQFDARCPDGWANVPGEEARRAAGRLLLPGSGAPGTSVAFELFDQRSHLIGRAITGAAALGAGITRKQVRAGLDLPFADAATLRRINDHVILEHQRCANCADPFGAHSSAAARAADLGKRRRWKLYLNLLATEKGRAAQ
jgi:hypothetical protein